MAKVLVIRGGALGDFILTLPTLRLLRESIPDCHLEVLGYQSIAQLAVAAGYAEAVRSLDHRGMALLFVPGAAPGAELEDWLKSFQLVVSYLPDGDGVLAENMQRLGVKTYLSLPSRVIDGAGYAAEQLAAPLEKVALLLDHPEPIIRLPHAEQRLPKRVAIHPGSGGLSKTWPLERWQQLGADLATQHELVLITGEAEADRGITAQLTAAWKGLRYLHWDSLPLPELAQRISSCAAFLGHDTGTAHLAAASGVPCHLFFGPTCPDTWAPRGAQVLRSRSGVIGDISYEEGSSAVLAWLCRTLAR
jgi:heptosyltransferase III